MYALKSQLESVKSFFYLLERELTEKLSEVLFGTSIKDYDDIPLPSESRKEEVVNPKPTPNRKRRRSVQLQLLLTKRIKRSLYHFILFIETVSMSSARTKLEKQVFENTYKRSA